MAEPTVTWHEGPALTELAEGESRSLKLGGRGIALFRRGEKLHAVENRCPHMGYPMTKGTLESGVLTCEWHNWRFDVRSGGCYVGSCDDLPVFEVRVVEGIVQVAIPGEVEAGERAFGPEFALVRNGLLTADPYTLAKGIALLIGRGCSRPELLSYAIRHATRHGASQHPGVQSAEELTAIVAAHELTALDDGLDPVLLLTQGIRMAAGPIRELPKIIPLPGEPLGLEDADEKLSMFVREQYAQAAERVLLSLTSDGRGLDELGPLLIAHALAPSFFRQRRVLSGIVMALDGVRSINAELARDLLPPWVGALLGSRRPQPRPEEVQATKLYAAAQEALEGREIVDRSAAVEGLAEELRGHLYEGKLPSIFGAITNALCAGAGVLDVLDGLALYAAERLTRYTAASAGDWPAVTAALRIAQALRRATRYASPKVRAAGLYHLAFEIWLTRWVSGLAPEKHDLGRNVAEGQGASDALERLKSGLASVNQREIIGGIASYSLGARAESAALIAVLVGEALRDDASIDLLASIHAAIGEYQSAELSEADRLLFLTGVARYAAHSKLRQSAFLSARFGRSFADQG